MLCFAEKDKVWACLERKRQFKNEAVFKSGCSMSIEKCIYVQISTTILYIKILTSNKGTI